MNRAMLKQFLPSDSQHYERWLYSSLEAHFLDCTLHHQPCHKCREIAYCTFDISRSHCKRISQLYDVPALSFDAMMRTLEDVGLIQVERTHFDLTRFRGDDRKLSYRSYSYNIKMLWLVTAQKKEA